MAANSTTTAPQQTEADSAFSRTIDYLFGRNTLIGIASLMLLTISGYATWSGMSDFIVGVSQSPAAQGREIPGGLSVSNEALVIAVVVALTFLMWLTLRETFGAGRTWRERLIVFPLYVFLALWSIGFGYGFWWSLIAGEEATRNSLSQLQQDAGDAGSKVAARLSAVKTQLDSVVSWSESQMAREESSGGSCGVASGAGRGPLYNARKSVRDAVASVRDGIETSWLGPVEKEVEDLKQSAAGLGGGTFEERQKDFEARAAAVRSGARRIAARSNELGRSNASTMRSLADVVSVPPGKVGFSCYDPTLADRLRQAADQADDPVTLDLPEASFNEGPAGVANAVKNLWSNIGANIAGAVGFVFNGFQSTGDAPGGTITGRDLIALLASLGIDLGLFALAALNPPKLKRKRNEIGREARQQIRDAIRMAIARAPDADMEWVRRHFIYHNKASYLVIPNLFTTAPDLDLVAEDQEGGRTREDVRMEMEQEASRALAMNQLAGVLDDLGLVRWPTSREFDELRAEEAGSSKTDLTEVRKQRLAELEKLESEGKLQFKLDKQKAEEIRNAEPLRNHGLFSKAEKMLQITGWSDKARRDIEIFKLQDTEGLTPLLGVLNEDLSAAASTESEAAASQGSRANDA